MNRIDYGYKLVSGSRLGKVTPALLNVIMASCSELGDAERTFATLNDFSKFDVVPDVDTLTYALESIASEMDKKENQNPAKIEQYVTITGAVLNMLDELLLTPTPHFIHEYIRILCRAREFDTAVHVLQQELAQPNGHALPRSMNLLAFQCANIGKFDVARELLTRSDPYGSAIERLDRMEQAYMKGIPNTWDDVDGGSRVQHDEHESESRVEHFDEGSELASSRSTDESNVQDQGVRPWRFKADRSNRG